MIECVCGQQFKKEANLKVHLRTEKHRIQLAKKNGVPISLPPLESKHSTDKVVQHLETAVKVLTHSKEIYQDVQDKIQDAENKSLIENIETFLILGLKWINKIK